MTNWFWRPLPQQEAELISPRNRRWGEWSGEVANWKTCSSCSFILTFSFTLALLWDCIRMENTSLYKTFLQPVYYISAFTAHLTSRRPRGNRTPTQTKRNNNLTKFTFMYTFTEGFSKDGLECTRVLRRSRCHRGLASFRASSGPALPQVNQLHAFAVGPWPRHPHLVSERNNI